MLLEAALESARKLGQHALETASLVALGRLKAKSSRLEEARHHAETAIQLLENLRGQLSSSRVKLSLAADRQDHYSLLIETLLALHEEDPAAGHDVRALEIHERSRARELLDRLSLAEIPRQRQKVVS